MALGQDPLAPPLSPPTSATPQPHQVGPPQTRSSSPQTTPSAQNTKDAKTPTLPAASDPRSDQILANVIQKIRTYPSLQAKVRHRASLYGQQVSGTGDYAQLGIGQGLQLRLELKLPVGDGIASLQHVCDGRHLWIRRAIGDQIHLERVDLRRVRAAAGPDWQVNWDHTLVGGMPRLLTSIAANFHFSAPVEAVARGGQPVWRLRGRLIKPLPQAKEAPDTPTHVELTIDRGATALPYRITYLSSVSSKSGTKLVPLVAVEWFDIRIGEPIDPLRFRYQAENYKNTTDAFIERLAKRHSQ